MVRHYRAVALQDKGGEKKFVIAYGFQTRHKMLQFICIFCQTANLSKRNSSNLCQYIFSVTPPPAIFVPPQGDEVTL